MTRDKIILEIIETSKELHKKNLLAGTDGNISSRLDDGKILITPSGLPKSKIRPDQMALIEKDGTVLEGKPSSELSMHLKVYELCPEAKFVIHAHPPTAVAWSIARPELKELPADCFSEVILALGSIPFVPYARPGSNEMGTNLAPYLPNHRVMVLSRHGGLSWGESLEEALNGIERLEHSSEMLWKAHTLGGITPLPKEEITFLKNKRKEIGPKTL
ncbi:MAG: class II aldolase/adducin family protein [Bacteriovoracaceae bacterium]